MKTKFLIIMCLIVINEGEKDKPEKLVCTLNTEDWSLFDEPIHDLTNITESEQAEADKVLGELWDLMREGKNYMSPERLFSDKVPKKHHPILKSCIEENAKYAKLSKRNFMLLLQATIRLSDLKAMLSGLTALPSKIQ